MKCTILPETLILISIEDYIHNAETSYVMERYQFLDYIAKDILKDKSTEAITAGLEDMMYIGETLADNEEFVEVKLPGTDAFPDLKEEFSYVLSCRDKDLLMEFVSGGRKNNALKFKFDRNLCVCGNEIMEIIDDLLAELEKECDKEDIEK